MGPYPKLPKKRKVVRRVSQYSLLQLLIVCTISAVFIRMSLIEGIVTQFEGIGGFLGGLVCAIALCVSTAWVVSQLPSVFALLAFVVALPFMILVADGGIGPLPRLGRALAAVFRGDPSPQELIVVLGSWYCVLLLVGLAVGWCIAILRERSDVYA